MDLRNTVDDAMNWFEELVRKIPGYGGYKEKEQRRAADTLLREHLARELEAQWSQINDLRSQMLIGAGLSYLDDVGRAARRLQTLIDKVKVAAEGYAGFFDPVKVKEEELDALYEFDNDMLTKVDEVANATKSVQMALDNSDEPGPSVRILNQTIDEIIEHFDRRKDVITGLIES